MLNQNNKMEFINKEFSNDKHLLYDINKPELSLAIIEAAICGSVISINRDSLELIRKIKEYFPPEIIFEIKSNLGLHEKLLGEEFSCKGNNEQLCKHCNWYKEKSVNGKEYGDYIRIWGKDLLCVLEKPYRDLLEKIEKDENDEYKDYNDCILKCSHSCGRVYSCYKPVENKEDILKEKNVFFIKYAVSSFRLNSSVRTNNCLCKTVLYRKWHEITKGEDIIKILCFYNNLIETKFGSIIGTECHDNCKIIINPEEESDYEDYY